MLKSTYDNPIQGSAYKLQESDNKVKKSLEFNNDL